MPRELKYSKEADDVKKAEETVRYYDRLLQESTSQQVSDPIPEEMKMGLEVLNQEREINLENIRESCVIELQRFIDARGSIDKQTGEVYIPLMTISDQNKASTIKKMQAAAHVISKIEHADSVEFIKSTLLQESTSTLCASKVGADLLVAINRCLQIADVATRDYSKLNTF